jgi:Flp pilus assembly pilin Flp
MLPRRLRSDEGGAAASEYAMLLVFVATVIGVSVQTLGTITLPVFWLPLPAPSPGFPFPPSKPYRDLVSRRLQLAGDSAECGAEVSTNQGKRRDSCNGDQRGDKGVLDRSDASLIFDEI